MKRNIFGVGEVVYDIIFKNNKPCDARPGGAVLNALVSLSRLGAEPSLVADCVNDSVGNIILDFLMENKVNTEYINWYKTGRSRLALAFLNECNDAEYLFYKMQSSDDVKLKFPVPCNKDIILFGSYYGIKPEIRKGLKEFLFTATKEKSVIVYDPNFRKSHLNMLEQVKPFIFENFKFSDIVKGSIEDFGFIYNTLDPQEIYVRFKKDGGKNLIITCAGKDVHFFNSRFSFQVPVPTIKPKSTIGAGDSFSAAIVFSLLKMNYFKDDIETISEENWRSMINYAIECAIDVCLSFENYISVK
jgi:fructokinase